MMAKIITAFIALIIMLFSLSAGKEETTLVTKRTPYSESATWRIEHYLEPPYTEYNGPIKSSRFPTSRRFGKIYWFYKVTPVGKSKSGNIPFEIQLDKTSLPSNVLQIYASSQCSIIDVDGKNRFTVSGDGRSVIIPYTDGFSGWKLDLAKQEDLLNQSAVMLPRKHLTIGCEINGYLICYETTRIEITAKVHSTLRLGCNRIKLLVSEWVSMLRTLEDEASGKDFNCGNRITTLFQNAINSTLDVKVKSCLDRMCDIILANRNTCN